MHGVVGSRTGIFTCTSHARSARGPRVQARRRAAALTALTALLLLLLPASAATAASPSSTPLDWWVTDGPVSDVEVRGDRAWVGGSFGRIGPRTGGGVVFDTTTSTRDATIDRTNGPVLVLYADYPRQYVGVFEKHAASPQHWQFLKEFVGERLTAI